MTFDFDLARENMVQKQIRPWDVTDSQTLSVFMRLPRERFVAEQFHALAYADMEIPIGGGQTTLRPVLQARLIQAMDVQPHHEVLQIGAGSGILTGYIALLASKVHALEENPDLAEHARRVLGGFRWSGHVQVELADAFARRCSEKFHCVCFCGATVLPPLEFLSCLHPNGYIVAICGQGPMKEVLKISGNPEKPEIESLFETDAPYLVGAEPRPHFTF